MGAVRDRQKEGAGHEKKQRGTHASLYLIERWDGRLGDPDVRAGGEGSHRGR